MSKVQNRGLRARARRQVGKLGIIAGPEHAHDSGKTFVKRSVPDARVTESEYTVTNKGTKKSVIVLAHDETEAKLAAMYQHKLAKSVDKLVVNL